MKKRAGFAAGFSIDIDAIRAAAIEKIRKLPPDVLRRLTNEAVAKARVAAYWRPIRRRVNGAYVHFKPEDRPDAFYNLPQYQQTTPQPGRPRGRPKGSKPKRRLGRPLTHD